MKKRLLAALLAVMMVVAMLPAALAADLDGHWAKTYIEYLDQEGVINPSASTGNYEPDREMTRAEFMRYINRAFHFTETTSISYSDVQSSAWYYETIQIAVKYGYINGVGNNRMDPLGDVTREQAAVIIGRLFKEDVSGVSASALPFSDRGDVSDWAAGYIKAAVDKGIISGYNDGTFRPQRVVTRGEVAKILYYYMGTSLSTAGKAYTGADLKSDTENVTISESCTLSNAVIAGDLYITEGVGSDSVTLNNVTVNGSLIVSGGTVTMMNTSSDYVIVSSPMGRLLQLTATGATHIAQTDVRCAAALYERGLTSGRAGFADVSVQGSERVSLTLDAAIDDLALLSAATVSTSDDTSVYHMEMRAEASITGYGSVYQADIYANGVSFASSVTVSGYELSGGVFATIGGNIVWTSSEAGVSPDEIQIDLYELDELGAGIDISIPATLSVDEAMCDGRVLDRNLDYTETSTGIRLRTEWLEDLSRGDYTLILLLSNGDRATIAIEVENSSPNADSHTAYFDRYYDSSDFRDVQVELDDVRSKSEIEAVILGWDEIDRDYYSFSSSSRELTLRRGVLAQLREGSYTITIELENGDAERVLLTVEDSTPSNENVIVRECDTANMDDLSFPIALDDEDVAYVTAEYDDDDLDEGGDYWTDSDDEIWLSEEILDYYRDEGDYELFYVTLSNGDEYTLVVDYI